MGFSEEIHRIHEVSDMQKNKNSSNKDLFSPSFSNGPIQDKPVIESKFAALGKNLILKQQNINERNDIMRNERQNTTNHLDFDVNEYIQKKTKGLENKKKLMSNFEKIQEEQPKLIPLQSFTSKHLQELMVPVVNAVQGTMVKMKKLDEKIEKKEVEKKNTIEKIMNKQNEIISFMMNKNEDKKEKRIKLKYKELQQELDKVELGLSPDYTKFNFLQEELNYFLNKEAEIESYRIL